MAKSWDDYYLDPVGHLYADEVREARVEGQVVAVRGLVMRGHYSLTAYVGVREESPLASWDYELLPLGGVHGGLTWGGAGDDLRAQGWWWYGWDYAHAFDRTWIEREMLEHGIQPYRAPTQERIGLPEETAWTVEMVLPQMRAAQRQMLDLAAQGWQPGQATIDKIDRERELFETLFNRFKRGEDVLG